ncbi:helix-turn-helix domain-containing protein [Streptomyces tubbatahanensis]|uniref:Helix-turn-helix domain-containing protein n=1 Tax=Streptomyces tubbatahanensis TaxID=2923272 RepID=A0ABY3Y271_9ACTN|nr:helix-turn-helix domain-containing protein [Streptomyces tubbatahanensis]UNT00719.1 helix-turn-helix domain-containing protein [Streptomyces tubbatahanensis]
MATAAPPQVGPLLREWRRRRRLSQLELSLRAQTSARHLSFVETGRSRPSSAMVLRLAEELDVPLRMRNQLLMAAGYAPAYTESPLDAPRMTAVRRAVRQVLEGHEPYPATVVDRAWNIVDSNASLALFTDKVAPALLEQPANALRVSLHPEGLAPHIANLGQWRAHLLGRLRRQIAAGLDGALRALHDELVAYPCSEPEPDVEFPGPADIFVPLRLRHGSGELAFFSTVATFGTPLEVTTAELAIESFFPADAATATALRDPAPPQ